jgi:penicillin-binding protein 1A
VAIVTHANPREVQALLATGERVRVWGDGLRWVQPALASTAGPDLALRRGSVIRVMRAAPPKNITGNPANSSNNSGNSSSSNREPVSEWQVTQWPEVEGAFVALSPSTGRVRALVGGFDFSRSAFNHASAAWRQPGSSFKPFLYSAAFEHGVMPETVVDDLPLLNNDGSEPNWSPQNSDGRFAGPITVHEALVRSRNLVSVRLVQHMGTTQSRKWAARFGFDINKMPADLTLALGTGSTTPLQMATAYAVLANGGHKVPAVLIERIVDASGKVIFEAPPAEPLNEANRVIPARNAFLVGTLLNAVTRSGTAAAAQASLKRVDLYGKTGTTNDAVDAWFAGFQPGVVGVAWVGYDTPRSLGDKESGGGVALPIWIDSMAAMLKGVPVSPMQAPPGLVMGPTDRRYDNWSPETGVVRIGKPVVDVAEAASAAGTGGVVVPALSEPAASASTR